MPIYEYFCPQCGEEFEVRRSFAEADKPASCPRCGAEGERMVSPVTTKLGFYIKPATKRKPLARPKGKTAKE